MRNNSHWKHILHTVLVVALMATVASCARTVRPTRQNVAMTGDYTKQAESGQNNAQDQRQGPGAQQGQPGQQGPQGPQGQRQVPPQGQGAQQAARRIITPNLVQSDQARKAYTALPAQVPADDPAGIAFNIYRKTGTAKAVKLNSTPIADVTWYLDGTADITQDNAWYVTSLVNGKESEGSASFSIAAHSPARPYLSIPLQTLEGYSPSDASAGDLDGDGEYEIVVKQVRREYDNSQRGVCTGTIKLEAYKLDGTFMWRIDLGPNIREGAHYTQFMVYDFDGDGKAEIICKTGEGTIDGTGKVIGDTDGDGITNYVNQTTGYILDGPEFFSVFEGATGKELARADYIARGPKEEYRPVSGRCRILRRRTPVGAAVPGILQPRRARSLELAGRQTDTSLALRLR